MNKILKILPDIGNSWHEEPITRSVKRTRWGDDTQYLATICHAEDEAQLEKSYEIIRFRPFPRKISSGLCIVKYGGVFARLKDYRIYSLSVIVMGAQEKCASCLSLVNVGHGYFKCHAYNDVELNHIGCPTYMLQVDGKRFCHECADWKAATDPENVFDIHPKVSYLGSCNKDGHIKHANKVCRFWNRKVLVVDSATTMWTPAEATRPMCKKRNLEL